MNSWFRAAVLTGTVAVVLGATCVATVAATNPLPPNATKISVHPGGTTAHIDAALTEGSAIAGEVTDANANPLQSAQVYALTPSGRTLGYTSTAFDGTYRIASLPPSTTGYAICVTGADASSSVRPVLDGYVSLCNGSTKFWWRGRKPPSDARFIATALSTTATANMILPDAGGISGTITSRATGNNLDGVYVYAYTATGYNLIDSYSDDGTYKITGLPAGGTYRVCFQPPYSSSHATGYVGQCYKNVAWVMYGKPAAHAQGIELEPGVTTVVNQSLPVAGAISGTVRTATKKPHPTDAAVIEAFAGGQSRGTASPDDNGKYRIQNLRPGKYKVCAYPESRVILQVYRAARPASTTRADAQALEQASAGSSDALRCWKDATWSGRGKLPKNARAVHVHAAKTASGINFRLPRPSASRTAISGRITARSGGNVGHAFVIAFRSDGRYAGEAVANKHGKYRLGVAPSPKSGYVVCAGGQRELRADTTVAATHDFGGRCWKDTAWTEGSVPKGAAAVKVTRGSTHKGINISLPAAGQIAGQVTFGGQPVSDLAVVLFDTTGRYINEAFTDDDGEYTLDDVSPADHKYEVCFVTRQFNLTPSASPDYGFRPQCFNNQPWNEAGIN